MKMCYVIKYSCSQKLRSPLYNIFGLQDFPETQPLLHRNQPCNGWFGFKFQTGKNQQCPVRPQPVPGIKMKLFS
jgi:hypothetical protein